MKNNIVFHSLGHAVLVFLYTAGVAWIMFNGEAIFGGEPKNFWGPVMFLMLFVLSAAVVGSLVAVKPIMLYLDGAKKEALKFFSYTVFWLFVITIVVFALRLWK